MVRLRFLSMHTQEQAGAIEETARGVEPSGAHRVVQRVDLVAQRQRRAFSAVDLPRAFVLLGDGAFLAQLLGLESLQIFRKFTDQITARNPHRQRDGLLRCGCRNRQRDVKQMGVKAGRLHLVVQYRGRHSRFHIRLRRPQRSSSRTRRWSGANAGSAIGPSRPQARCAGP